MHIAFVSNIDALPEANDPAAAARGLEDWDQAIDRLDDDCRTTALATTADGAERRILGALFGNSPFLGQSALRQNGFLTDSFHLGPDAAFDKLLRSLKRDLENAGYEDAATRRLLRQARQRASLLIAVADIVGAWDGRRVTEAISQFAEDAVEYAVTSLLRAAADTGDFAPKDPADPGTGSGLIVLGMGKLGARELNYSSDIDLIIFFDADRAPYTGTRGIHDFFVRIAQNLARMLEERTADGYVFRTDLRLRPDPSATAPAVSVAAAESYYASLGQNWERAAMIKARPIAGDIDAGDAFLAAIRPFMWRKHLDFAAIQDIQSIKRQIRSHKGGGTVAARGHNVKLGRGGIREIEFFAQTQQLIWGGRYPELRERRTDATLSGLAALDRIDKDAERDLIDSYWFLRRVEHRLQMIDDRQTHSLPKDEDGFDHVAAFLGYPSPEAFEITLTEHLTRVSEQCAQLFEDSPVLGAPIPEGGVLSFTGTDDNPETLDTLQRMGFAEATSVSKAIRSWHHGRIRATRSTRARELLTELTPTLLAALAQTANPDQSFARFVAFLSNMPAGVQLFSLFQAAPNLLELFAEIVGAAPRIADYLSRHSRLFDTVLARDFYDDLPDKVVLRATLDRELSMAADLQDRLENAHDWAADAKFQVSVQQLLGMRDVSDAAPALSDIADVLLEVMLKVVSQEFAIRHGTIPDAEFAIIGFGKLGSRLLARGSDLDLVFVYGVPEPHAESDGERPLAAPVYFARLCQRLISAINVQTAAGLLYEVDVRLRPMGNDGPLASDIAAFERYYREEAWTWEIMALGRARVVTGGPTLTARIETVATETLRRDRDPVALAGEVADMRARMAKEHGTDDPFSIKHVRGGLIDVEFITAYLQLRDAAEKPEILVTGTFAAIEALMKSGSLDRGPGEDLIEAATLYYNIQAILRLSLSGEFDENTAPEGLRRALCRAGEASDFNVLKARLAELQARVREYFAIIIRIAEETGER
jgi:glutamate-ammonia-ligase adenylyltransferase